MKLVIDIPKEMIISLEQGSFGAKYNIYDLVGCVMNGTPLTERPKGKWIKTEGSFKCSECLIFPEYIRTLNYCPSCGSYNGGEEEDEDGKSL